MTWAIDLGNSHTRIARWNEQRELPELVELPGICRQPGGNEPLAAPRLVPTATEVLESDDWRTRVGRWPFVRDLAFLGQRAIIGRPAIERNLTLEQPDFVPNFKSWLGRRSREVLARTASRTWTAREVAEAFLWELLATVDRQMGERIRDLVITTPVHAFESYRAELQTIAKRLGVRRLRFADEPVAAALGYGLSVGGERRVLVIDFGAGTLDLALVALDPRGVEMGQCRVLAKDGQELGGNDVDAWFLEELVKPFDVDPSHVRGLRESAFWRREMLAEARRVKEALFFDEWTFFLFHHPDGTGRPRPGRDRSDPTEIHRQRLLEVLERHRVAERVEEAILRVLVEEPEGVGFDGVDEVLLVGGSTLLPGVYSRAEELFGRSRVRAWEPFEAVALGACVLSAQRFAQSDVIFHDYAFVTHDTKTHEPQTTVIVPAGTRVPTSERFWTGRVVPTCALGDLEKLFKLVICEVARPREGTRFVRDRQGGLYRGDESGSLVVVPLNESDPLLGRLDPPHEPSDRKPRLELSFSVDTDRWLRATVDDLKTGKRLLESRQVVRLV
ncbi:MAG: Hsp70 family protein [Thermoanaerobaculia bacterium]|nr:Hsp70 family protein [Thermoanaerobaculia bacterium]